MFCKKCGGLLKPVVGECFECTSCGWRSEECITLQHEEKHKMKIITEGKIDTNPIVQAECKKCGNKEAYYAFKQTRGSDEAPTKFFRCTKCGKTWREYD